MDFSKLFTESSIHLSSTQLCIITFVCKPADVYGTNVKSRCAKTNVASISGNINSVVSSSCETTVESIRCILSSVEQYI